MSLAAISATVLHLVLFLHGLVSFEQFAVMNGAFIENAEHSFVAFVYFACRLMGKPPEAEDGWESWANPLVD
jgi:hypothetical protein